MARAFLGSPFPLREVRVQHKALEGLLSLPPVGVFEGVGPMAGTWMPSKGYSASGPRVEFVRATKKDEGLFFMLL